jgi:3-carboxy-cis,cis-muconate cycloisomerase
VILDAVFGAEEISDADWVESLCRVETALTRAAVTVGLVEAAAAERVLKLWAEPVDLEALRRDAVAGGNPVIPLVDAVRSRAGDDAPAVHVGATSQDVMDTAVVLLARATGSNALGSLGDCADRCAELAREHRVRPMIGRTLLQQAAPTTVGALVTSWGTALDACLPGLAAAVLALPVSYGGAAGTMAAVHPHGPALRAAFAAELGLPDPGRTWHADRTPVLQLAAALGIAASVVGMIATDVVLLAQTEIGEVHEAAPGGSSAMPHKQNPIAAITARAAAAQAPGLVATVLAQAPELQRGAGPWHAEWPALQRLLQSASGAASRLRTCLDGLSFDLDAVARNLADTAPDTGHAADLVDAWLETR